MPNTLTTIFTSTPASEPVESPHPNTGAYVLGTQLANGTWQVIHTLVTKTSTPPTVTGRLKNFPAVAASVVASGNVLNNVLAQPTGTSAVASSASAINATVSSNANATAYRLLTAMAAAGPYSPLYQGAAAGFAHTGLTAGTTYYYEWQYVGGGYFDDSPVSGPFSGSTGVTDYKVTPVAADWVSNVISGATYSATGQLSPLSYIYVSTDATSVTTAQHSQLPEGGAMSAIGILSGTSLVESVSTDFTGAVQQINSVLPGSGQRLLKIVTGPSRETNSAHTVAQTNVDSLVFHNATNATIVAQPTPASRIVIGGDSISSGFITTHPASDSTARQLETLLGYQVAVYGWGNRSFGRDQFTAAQQDAVVTSIAAWLNAPGVSLKEYWGELGINDVFGFGTQTAAALRPVIASFYAKLQAAVPGIRIWAQSPTYHTNTYASYNVDTAANYAAAFIGAASDVANVVYVDGTSLTTNDATVLAADNVHLNTLGQSQAAQTMYNIINAVAQPFVLGTKFLRIDGSENFAYTSFTVALSFTANVSTANSLGQLAVHGYNPPNGTYYTLGSFAIYVNGGQVIAYAPDGTTTPTPDANKLTATCPTSGVVIVMYSAGPSGQQLRVGSTVINGPGLTLASTAGIKLAIGATPTAATGTATQANILNCPASNFSLFKRVLTTAEKDSVVAANGVLSQALATDAALLSYSRLIPQSTASTALLDNVTNTLRIQVLTANATANTGFILSAGMTYANNVFTRTGAYTNSPDVYATGREGIATGGTGLLGTIDFGTIGGTAGRVILTPVLDAAALAGEGDSPGFYIDTRGSATYGILKNHAFVNPAGAPVSVGSATTIRVLKYADRLDYELGGTVVYTYAYASTAGPHIPKIYLYEQNITLTGLTLTGNLVSV
ncbi:SGNH/GDSL hydrolase family protein [Hymenobacter nivis]|uniref:Uncharacterized protein n=1 Tax=Hymenobacter nivis TaxID=1850093 RepID=A0A2Z3GCT9_9BACT|nr:SGNH/GDSL hydrolase family protein [Hymenobacter nivis]AWM31369.1 hypothetical protein DDQ68_00340 [Hymenobacter nivis]